MYPSRGSNAYGQQQQQQQPFSAQSAYGKSLGSAFSDGGQEGASRHSSMLGGPQETDIAGYRGHPSVGAHYGGQYSSLYGSSALTASQQAAPTSGKGSGQSALESRGGYGSGRQESPKFSSGDYVSSSSHGYGQKADKFINDKISDYPSMDRRPGSYLGRDVPIEPTSRFNDSIGFAHQHQPDLYERIDQAAMLRQEHMMKAQSLQSASFDGVSRQADYHAARGATLRHPAQDLASYGGRMDADLSMLSGSTYGAAQPPSILGAAPRRNADDIVYAQSSSNAGYGVSLPPGRDYATGKGLHGASLELDFPGGLLPRGSHQMIDDRKDERGGYAKELDRREEERRRDHMREREKDREREKERERDRERERKRARSLERRRKDKDRESKRGSEVRREPTPPRASKDSRAASLLKEGRSARRESPRHDAPHRRRSPVKEKRRDYICKVYSSNFTEVVRDYISMDKRYPKLFISPECSKVVVNWPREDLKLPLRKPISFEHDFVEEEAAAEPKLLPTNLLPTKSSSNKSAPTVLSAEPVKLESGTSVWNAKMILMSGLSQNSLDELSSERTYGDRIPHFCNMLRFAVLKNGGSLMAIGGPWDTIDGGDPSTSDISLVHTVTRYAKDVAELDLKSCHNWNRFLEIHYDRVGKDGLFSHKEVTVLYVPDLSECLPSLDTWRDQWFAHKKVVAEREKQYALRKEKSREKEGLKVKDKEPDSKDLKKDVKSEKKKETESPGQAADINKKDKNVNKPEELLTEKEGSGSGKKIENKDGVETSVEGDNSEKKEQGDIVPVQTAVEVKPGKRKIIKKVIKQKVAVKKDGEESSTKQNEKVGGKDVTVKQDDPAASSAAVQTFTRKKVVKKVQVGQTAQKEDEDMQQDVKSVKEYEGSDNKKKGTDSSNVVQDTVAKKTVKKKIIKRVPKRKAAAVEANDGVTDIIKDGDKDDKKVVQGGKIADPDNQESEEKSQNKKLPITKSKSMTSEKQDDADNLSKIGNKDGGEHHKEENRSNEKSSVSGSKPKAEDDKSQKDGHKDKIQKSKEKEKPKDDKERKDKDGKSESMSKSNREVKDKKRPEEPPRHPGLFLRTKASKDSKLRSLSLSLDSLLDYTDQDIEESTFELSLFAETLYEMLQFQMGSRLLTFLEKLRIKFVTKRNQRKRRREDNLEKGNAKKPATKHLKTEATVKKNSIKTETENEANIDVGKEIAEDNISSEKVAQSKPKGEADEDAKLKPNAETDEDEDPEEEDPEEDEVMVDGSPEHESNEDNAAAEADVKSEKVDGNGKDELQETSKDNSNTKSKGKGEVPNSKEISDANKPKLEAETKEASAKNKEKKETSVIIDKDLLQAFRFFDRNRAGYIRVEDMRLIIHNLGKFKSHRDVKELVQSGLIESNTGRDDRILYDKLVTMPGL